jgi:hypothetical protein
MSITLDRCIHPSHGPGSSTVSKKNREDALATAIDFLNRGIPIVTTTGDAITYMAEEFALTLGEA